MITSRTLEIHTILYFKLWADIKLALAFRQVFFLLRYFLHDASSVNDTKKIYFFCSATETHSLCLSFRFFFFVSATYEYVRRRLIGQITYTNWVLCIRFVLGSCLSLTLNTTVKCVCFECPLSLSLLTRLPLYPLTVWCEVMSCDSIHPLDVFSLFCINYLLFSFSIYNWI